MLVLCPSRVDERMEPWKPGWAGFIRMEDMGSAHGVDFAFACASTKQESHSHTLFCTGVSPTFPTLMFILHPHVIQKKLVWLMI
jgi:hypothetical protein